MTKLYLFTSRPYWFFYISIALLTLISQYLTHSLTPVLEYNREAILDGQYWRLLTGHFVHLSWYHWLVNSGGLILTLVVLHPNTRCLNELVLWLLLTLGISLGLLWLAPDLNFYLGLSGVLHGVFIVAIIRSPYYPQIVRYAILAVIALKLGWELSPWYDELNQLQQLGGRVETRAHLMGSVLAVLWIMVIKKRALRYAE